MRVNKHVSKYINEHISEHTKNQLSECGRPVTVLSIIPINGLAGGGLLVFALALTGCEPEQSHVVNDAVKQHPSGLQMTPDEPAQSVQTQYWQQDKHLKQKVTQLQRQLDNSHAKYASRTKDLCPKLIEPRVDSPRIVRTGDKLHKGHCEYHVYLEKGQQLSAVTDNDKVSISMVQPEFFDFANGTYTVKHHDRHIITAAYDSFERMPKDFSYSLQVDIQ